jgi:hypothetical protein
MKKLIVLSTLLALSTPLMASVEVGSVTKAPTPKVATTESFDLIVTFKDQSVHKSLLAKPSKMKMLKARAKSRNVSLSSLKTKYNIESNVDYSYGVQSLESLGSKHSLEFNHVRSMALGGDLIKVTSDSPMVAQKVIIDLINSGDFKNVMLDIKVSKTNYNDPKFDEQTYLKAYSASNLYGQDYVAMKEKVVNNLGRKIRIGVGDTGYAPSEDISDVVEGYDFMYGSNALFKETQTMDSDPTDATELAAGGFCHDGHGLSVAGLIAAKSNNGLGVVGAMDSDNVDLVFARVLDCFGNGSSSGILNAVSWMIGESVPDVPDIETPVDIINLSLGGFSNSGCSSYDQTVYSKARENGVVVVVAAGNSNSDASTFVPAACNDVITVGATTDNGDKASFSNYGEHVDVMAAGDSVWMLASNTYVERPIYFQGSGTSMAAPNITAGIGNLLLTYPTLAPDQVENLLVANGRGLVDGSICDQLGCGSGAVDMTQLMDAIPNILTSVKYNKEHRYEGYESEAQEIWLDKMNTYANTCDMIKYTWGQIGSEMSGVNYKLYMADGAEELTYTETVVEPQKVYNHSATTVIGVQACQGGSCGDIIQMRGQVIAPSSCN